MLLQAEIVKEKLQKLPSLAQFSSFETANYQKHVYCEVQWGDKGQDCN